MPFPPWAKHTWNAVEEKPEISWPYCCLHFHRLIVCSGGLSTTRWCSSHNFARSQRGSQGTLGQGVLSKSGFADELKFEKCRVTQVSFSQALWFSKKSPSTPKLPDHWSFLLPLPPNRTCFSEHTCDTPYNLVLIQFCWWFDLGLYLRGGCFSWVINKWMFNCKKVNYTECTGQK